MIPISFIKHSVLNMLFDFTHLINVMCCTKGPLLLPVKKNTKPNKRDEI